MQGLWFGPLLAALVVTACGGGGIAKKQSVLLNLDAVPAVEEVEAGPSSFTLIGVADQATLPSDVGANSIIFTLDQAPKIAVKNGPFKVEDMYGTDGTAAVQLPLPEGVTEAGYIMHARILVDLPESPVQAACEADKDTGVRYCASTVILTQTADVPGEMDLANAFIELDLDGDGTLERLQLFDDRLQDIFWRDDESGSRRAEVRFAARPAFSSKTDSKPAAGCEYDCPDAPSTPKPTPKPVDPKPTPKPTPKPDSCCDPCCHTTCDCKCDSYCDSKCDCSCKCKCDDSHKPDEEPRDPDDPD